jgi:beta-glucosidase
MPNTPLFAFGHGLSYTNFEISEPRLSATKINPSQKLRVDVTVKNVGDYDGEETVQLYVRDMVGSVTRPVKLLRGFQKVFLKKGEARDVAMNLTVDDLKFYDRQMKWTYEPGAFQVMVGPDSVNVKSADFTLINGKASKPAGELAKAN